MSRTAERIFVSKRIVQTYRVQNICIRGPSKKKKRSNSFGDHKSGDKRLDGCHDIGPKDNRPNEENSNL